MVATYDDVDRFFNELSVAVPPHYKPEERHTDLRAVFFGHSTPEQGKRALYTILEMCGLYRDPTSFVTDDEGRRRTFSPELTQQAIGRQSIARRLIHALHAKYPANRPEQATKTKE